MIRCLGCGGEIRREWIDQYAPVDGTFLGVPLVGGHVVAGHDPNCGGGWRCDQLCPIPIPCGPVVEDDLT